LAERLASDFGITDVELLAAAMAEGLAKGKIVSKEVFHATIDGKEIILDELGWNSLWNAISTAVFLKERLKEASRLFKIKATNQLASALDDFLAQNVPRWEHNTFRQETG
jgi:hypothetical protein